MRERKQTTRDEDHELISMCKKGEVEAFEVLVEKHQKRMFNIAYRMVGNYEEACEIVQDAFISAYRSMKSFKGKARFSTWLSAIVMNLIKTALSN